MPCSVAHARPPRRRVRVVELVGHSRQVGERRPTVPRVRGARRSGLVWRDRTLTAESHAQSGRETAVAAGRYGRR